MPGNIITINSSEDLEWYVGDSNMEELIKFLDKIGYKIEHEKHSQKGGGDGNKAKTTNSIGKIT